MSNNVGLSLKSIESTSSHECKKTIFCSIFLLFNFFVQIFICFMFYVSTTNHLHHLITKLKTGIFDRK